MCAMEISGNAVANGAGDVIPVPSDRVSGSIPEFIQRSGVMKNMGRMEGNMVVVARGNKVVAQGGNMVVVQGKT